MLTDVDANETSYKYFNEGANVQLGRDKKHEPTISQNITGGLFKDPVVYPRFVSNSSNNPREVERNYDVNNDNIIKVNNNKQMAWKSSQYERDTTLDIDQIINSEVGNGVVDINSSKHIAEERLNNILNCKEYLTSKFSSPSFLVNMNTNANN